MTIRNILKENEIIHLSKHKIFYKQNYDTQLVDFSTEKL